LPQALKERFHLSDEEEVYVKVVKSSIVADIERKMRERAGLTLEEMEIAADLGLIRRDQFWHWTPESQASMRRGLEDLEQGRYETFDSVDELFAIAKAACYVENIASVPDANAPA
jgi:transcriptional regulator with XRE-family HTH domain